MKKLALALVGMAVLLSNGNLAHAQRAKGPGLAVTTVPAYGAVTYWDTFLAGGRASVMLTGNGRTDLDIFIYDDVGNLIVQGIGPTDIETVRWTPLWTGRFRIVIRNLGPVPNTYVMTTN